ncbi:MAG: hypothetical protein IJH07_03200 [Ruminococcus sp.]|nr:hypothetical protein [Ruminococcus sp.]
MKKDKYERTALEITEFLREDVIATSGDSGQESSRRLQEYEDTILRSTR